MTKVFKSAVVIISLTMFVNFLFATGVGVYRTIHAFMFIYYDGLSERPGLEIAESLDVFLVALVFLIISLSFMKLFYPEFSWFNKIHLPWLQINDFYQLKHLIWSAFLLTLLITFGTQVIRANGNLEWTILIIPASVLLFSISAKLLKH